jgi:hypothetical protein
MKAINASGEFGLRHANGDTKNVFKATRKANAIGSKSFIRKRIIKGGRLYEFNKSKMRKKAKLALKRSRAMNPQLEQIGRKRQMIGNTYT